MIVLEAQQNRVAASGYFLLRVSFIHFLSSPSCCCVSGARLSQAWVGGPSVCNTFKASSILQSSVSKELMFASISYLTASKCCS